MGGSIGEHVWRQSYKISTSQVTFGANLIKCQLLMSTSTVILARILQSVNFSIYRYILGNTNTGVCSDIGNTNTSIHPVSYCPIWDEAVLIPDLIGRPIPNWGSACAVLPPPARRPSPNLPCTVVRAATVVTKTLERREGTEASCFSVSVHAPVSLDGV